MVEKKLHPRLLKSHPFSLMYLKNNLLVLLLFSGWDKIEKRREIFQLDDGVPTFLKMGFWDNILYRLTACAVVGGNVWSFYTLYQFANMP